MNILPPATWGAQLDQLPTRPMTLPAKELWLHHSVTTVTNKPAQDMKVIERVGLSRFGQISYSYAVHPDGTLLEGAGLKVGAHTAGHNSIAFGVVWVGNYDERSPTAAQIDATRWLISHLISAGRLLPGTYPTGGHRDVRGAATACPGAKAYRILDQLRRPWEPAPSTLMEVPPMINPPIEIAGRVVAVLKAPGGGVWMLTEPGAVYAWECPDRGAPNRHPEYWANRKAARLEPFGDGYTVVASDGARYDYG